MTEEKTMRKLTAIFYADVKGYSRLMRNDEAATVETLKQYRSIMAGFIRQHNGKVVDASGDSLLAEFASVVDAVRCAVEVQQALKIKNTELPETRKMLFRIGINLGDVMVEGDRIYGDGINIAARIESLAEPGGLSISRSAYDQVKNKLPLSFEYSGEQMVKNIEEPVRVYRVILTPWAAGKADGKKRDGKVKRRPILVAAVIVTVFLTAALWFLLESRTDSVKDSTSTGQTSHLTSGKPSIAVLPFKNLSGDPEQEYFSDGVTNDIITDLSKFHDLLVIASNTVFTFKGKNVKVQEVGRQLAVRYVLEGSVQKAADQVRINVQLIDADTEHHLWADRFDRSIEDLFAVQSEIVKHIVTRLAVKIDTVERKRVRRKEAKNFEVYDYILRGRDHLSRPTRSDNIQARRMFEKALEYDPSFASAYALLGRAYMDSVTNGYTEFPDQALRRAEEFAAKALQIDKDNVEARNVLGLMYIFKKQYHLAVSELEKAIELNPNAARSYRSYGWVLVWSGQPQKAIEPLETGLRIDPDYGGSGAYLFLGIAYYLTDQNEPAIRILQKGIGKVPGFSGLYIILAAVYADSGRSADAIRTAEQVRRKDPFFKIDTFGSVFQNKDHREKIVAGLRKAGLE
jgi:adenylate cyclase